jgi:hypothetical protein
VAHHGLSGIAVVMDVCSTLRNVAWKVQSQGVAELEELLAPGPKIECPGRPAPRGLDGADEDWTSSGAPAAQRLSGAALFPVLWLVLLALQPVA